MSNYKKIKNLEEIYKDNQLLIESFDDLDLSNLDLSSIPQELINDISINYSNLHNSNLNLKLTALYYVDCDLRGNNIDFSGLKRNDGKTIYFDRVKFDEKQIKEINNYIQYVSFSIETLDNNKNLQCSDRNLMMISRYGVDMNDSTHFKRTAFHTEEEITLYKDRFFELLKKSKYRYLEKLFLSIKEEMNIIEINHFFKGYIANKTIENLTLDKEFFKFVSPSFTFYNCNFNNIIFDLNIEDIKEIEKEKLTLKLEERKHLDMKIPNISMSDWKDINNQRFGATSITFRKNLYLELDRICNSHCIFCRNDCMNEDIYDFEKILFNLKKIHDKVDQIIIGGGEPTVRYNDLIKILEYIKVLGDLSKTVVFTNATNNILDLADKYQNNTSYKKDGMLNFYISRHSHDEDINAKIFNLDKDKFMKWNDIAKLRAKTLACTCIKNGVDSKEKIIRYLNEAYDFGIESIIFSDIQKDASLNTNANNQVEEIDEDLFTNTIELLKKQGFTSKTPIISSGGYKVDVLKLGYLTLSFKKYLNKQQLEEEWKNATKRTFDLSMAPNGNIYENWHQTENKVLIKK